MKSNGSNSLLGLLIFLGVVVLVVGLLWSAAGVLPSTSKGWIFILFMVPVMLVLAEYIGNVVIDLVDYALPKIRYIRRAIAERMLRDQLDEERMPVSLSASQYLLYGIRAAVVIGIVAAISIWLYSAIDLPYREHVVATIRLWWYENFK